MNSARVSRNLGSVHAASAVSSTRRLPTSGRVRPGIKVLTRAASAVQGVADTYAKGLAAGASFDEIGAALSKLQGIPKYPLTPKNAPYFTVRQGDFSTPGAVDAIMSAHATVRPEDPEPRLYALPIIFPSDDVDLVFRETFEAWKATELLRWSESDPESSRLMCMKRADVAPAKGAARRWGGRPTEAVRACNPNDCDLFAAGECKHVAALNFWIPGVKGAGVIELTFTSIYASLGIAETLEMVRAGLGRISGLYRGQPIFWLSKVQENVSRMNWETGKPEKSKQWIIRLEASGLDMVEVLTGTGQEAPPALSHVPAPVAVAALAAPETAQEPAPEQAQGPAPEPAAAPAPDPTIAAIAEGRQHLCALFDTLEWDQKTRTEWLSDNYPDTAAATRDPAALTDMATKLEGLLKAVPATQAVTEAAAQITPAPEPAAADPSTVPDEEVPF